MGSDSQYEQIIFQNVQHFIPPVAVPGSHPASPEKVINGATANSVQNERFFDHIAQFRFRGNDGRSNVLQKCIGTNLTSNFLECIRFGKRNSA
jgi:hypothetical protein